MAAKDVYVNQAYLKVIESAANTLTFSKLETGISIFEKVGWLISRIDYLLELEATNFGATNDSLSYGVSVSDQITSPSIAQNAVIDWNRVKRIDFGTAASGSFDHQPKEKRFSAQPGGGILVPPNPIYIFCKGSALTTAITLQARMFYTVIQLKLDEFWELVETRRMIGA